MVRHTKRVQSVEERIIRKHHADVRKLQKWAFEHQTNWYDFETARNTSICVLSLNEYEIGEPRKNISEYNESYYLDEEVYDAWCETKENLVF